MPKKILIIDDEELVVRSLSNALKRSSYEVMIAKRSEDAFIMIEEEGFDLIISDIRMPGLNGVETVRRIFESLKERNVNNVPAIFITGYADEKLEMEARSLHPKAYIHKPFDLEDFLKRVKEALA